MRTRRAIATSGGDLAATLRASTARPDRMVKLPDPKPPRCLVSAGGLSERADQARFHLVQAMGLEGACSGALYESEPVQIGARVVSAVLCEHHARQWSAAAIEMRRGG